MKTFPAVETLVDVSELSEACLANLKAIYTALTTTPDSDSIEVTVGYADPSGNNKQAVEIKLTQTGSTTLPSFSKAELSVMCFSYEADFPENLRFSKEVANVVLNTVGDIESAPYGAISNILRAKTLTGEYKVVNANIHGYTPPDKELPSNLSCVLMMLNGLEGISLHTTAYA